MFARLVLAALLALVSGAARPALAADKTARVVGTLPELVPSWLGGRDIHPVVQALTLPDMNVAAQTKPDAKGAWQLEVPVGKQYQVRVQTDDDWLWSTPQTVTVKPTDTLVELFGLRGFALDNGVHGLISGDQLGADQFKKTHVTARRDGGGTADDVRPDGRYSLFGDNQTTSWNVVKVEYDGDAPHDGRIDILQPLHVDDPHARFDWTLPSLGLSNVNCVPPGNCTFSVNGSGWIPGAEVDFYLVDFGRSDRGGLGPQVSSPDNVGDYAQAQIGSVSADDAGRVGGDVEGATAQPWPLFIRENGAWSIEAVQQTGNEFKAVQPADAFDYPPAQVVITIDDPNAPQLTVTSP